ncbi:LysE family translocator [Paucibacter oligotrophus]|uniref:LysE family translocator n=2 Tax=Roseateles oligotrophus TaxID=1769250 RepID=A0ABT2YML0_9BURK|nr:LysE family translocator [Roseateles oligotrophus]
MSFSTWLLFLGVSLLTTLSPGPGVLLAVSNSVSQGLMRTMLSSLGNALGIVLVSSAAMAGLGAAMAASALLFAGMKLAGAGYLIYLGIKQWRSLGNVFATAPRSSGLVQRSAPSLLMQGLLVALTNPKSILFFTALFPQFIHTELPVLPQFMLLTATFVACALLSHALYASLARHVGGFFSTRRRVVWFNRGSGGAFVFLGLSLVRLHSPAA